MSVAQGHGPRVPLAVLVGAIAPSVRDIPAGAVKAVKTVAEALARRCGRLPRRKRRRQQDHGAGRADRRKTRAPARTAGCDPACPLRHHDLSSPATLSRPACRARQAWHRLPEAGAALCIAASRRGTVCRIFRHRGRQGPAFRQRGDGPGPHGRTPGCRPPMPIVTPARQDAGRLPNPRAKASAGAHAGRPGAPSPDFSLCRRRSAG